MKVRKDAGVKNQIGLRIANIREIVVLWGEHRGIDLAVLQILQQVRVLNLPVKGFIFLNSFYVCILVSSLLDLVVLGLEIISFKPSNMISYVSLHLLVLMNAEPLYLQIVFVLNEEIHVPRLFLHSPFLLYLYTKSQGILSFILPSKLSLLQLVLFRIFSILRVDQTLHLFLSQHLIKLLLKKSPLERLRFLV